MNPFLSPTFIIAILIALSVHEWAHAFAANKLGDPTAKMQGRLTLNPISHLDPIGTVLFLLVGFGWGKPVPIDPRYFKHEKRDTAITALAGPVSNLILATIAFGILLTLGQREVGTTAMALLSQPEGESAIRTLARAIAQDSLFINLALMAFNLLPVAPLDGSKVIRPFIPLRYEYQYEEFMRRGPFILLGILLIDGLLNIPILSGWVFGIMQFVLGGLNAIANLLF